MGVDRQQDLQSATMAGRPEEVGRISQLIIQGAQEWHGAILAQGALLLRVTEGTFWSFFFCAQGMEHFGSARRMVTGGPRLPAVRWPKAPRGRGQERAQSSNKKDANKGSSQPPQGPVPEVRRGPPQVSPVAQERAARPQTAVDASRRPVPRPRCCAMSVYVSTLVPNLSRERGTGCPEPTKCCGKHKTNGSGWNRS